MAENKAPYDAGVPNEHVNIDKKDERSFANKIDAVHEQQKAEIAEQVKKAAEMPTEAARKHGNEPSKGAVIDEQLKLEDEAELLKKGKA